MIEMINLENKDDCPAFFAVRRLGQQRCPNLIQRVLQLVIFHTDHQGCSAPPQKSASGCNAGYAEIVRGERL